MVALSIFLRGILPSVAVFCIGDRCRTVAFVWCDRHAKHHLHRDIDRICEGRRALLFLRICAYSFTCGGASPYHTRPGLCNHLPDLTGLAFDLGLQSFLGAVNDASCLRVPWPGAWCVDGSTIPKVIMVHYPSDWSVGRRHLLPSFHCFNLGLKFLSLGKLPFLSWESSRLRY